MCERGWRTERRVDPAVANASAGVAPPSMRRGGVNRWHGHRYVDFWSHFATREAEFDPGAFPRLARNFERTSPRLTRVKEGGKNAGVQVAMLTGEGKHSMIERAKKAGAKGWIVKPFKAELLSAAVRRLVLE
ncbi:MAG TPA: hypothetical protein VK550_21395 [Polyangiaceae bacterium]|nr:hypothetical protein [Polyangiaceae bacterium]